MTVRLRSVCAGIELDRLDADLIKLLAYQRIHQLFPPKAPSTPPSPAPSTASKSLSPHPDSKTPVTAERSIDRKFVSELKFVPSAHQDRRRCRSELSSILSQEGAELSACVTGPCTSDQVGLQSSASQHRAPLFHMRRLLNSFSLFKASFVF